MKGYKGFEKGLFAEASNTPKTQFLKKIKLKFVTAECTSVSYLIRCLNIIRPARITNLLRLKH